jgi:hypothetical protein
MCGRGLFRRETTRGLWLTVITGSSVSHPELPGGPVLDEPKSPWDLLSFVPGPWEIFSIRELTRATLYGSWGLICPTQDRNQGLRLPKALVLEIHTWQSSLHRQRSGSTLLLQLQFCFCLDVSFCHLIWWLIKVTSRSKFAFSVIFPSRMLALWAPWPLLLRPHLVNDCGFRTGLEGSESPGPVWPQNSVHCYWEGQRGSQLPQVVSKHSAGMPLDAL